MGQPQDEETNFVYIFKRLGVIFFKSMMMVQNAIVVYGLCICYVLEREGVHGVVSSTMTSRRSVLEDPIFYDHQ